MIYKCGDYDIMIFTFMQQRVLKHINNASTNIYIYDSTHQLKHNIVNIFSLHIDNIHYIHHYLHTFVDL